MNYQCAKCGREIIWNETLSFCPFCGNAYATVSVPQTVITQRIVIGADGERTVQEKYWHKNRQELASAIRKIRFSLPFFQKERPNSDDWQRIPKQYDAKELDADAFLALRHVSSTAEFRTKLCRYLDDLREAFEIKSGILEKLRRDVEAHPRPEKKNPLPGGLALSAFEDEYSIRIEQEKNHILDQCLILVQTLRCGDAAAWTPVMRYAPKNGEWAGGDADIKDSSVLSASAPAYKELINVLMDIRNVLVKIVEDNSTFVLSALRLEKRDDEEKNFDPFQVIQRLKKLSQGDFDPVFGQSPDELIQAFAEAVCQCTDFVNELPSYWDLLDQCPNENILIFKTLLDKYKLDCLRAYLSGWSESLEQELDRAYQEQRMDMIALSRELERIAEEIPDSKNA